MLSVPVKSHFCELHRVIYGMQIKRMTRAPTKARAIAPREARRRGRPALSEGGATQIAVRFPDAMLEILDRELAKRIDGQDRSTMIRELVAEGMKARGWVR